MKQLEFKNYIKNLCNFLIEKNSTIMVTSNNTYVLNGLYQYYNSTYCEKNNIEVLNTEHFGGAIVNFRGDICISNFQADYNTFGSSFMLKFKNFLENKNLNCTFDNNDLLIDGFKCASFMSTNIDNTIYTAIHISVNVDVNLINNICTKPMVKIPKGLSEFSVTTEEIIDFINKEIGE